ncbi:DNA cytosine methyltransferase [uncultured Clostridium sp.]|uniref:DNA cytosine methyltransferase n=1 Tax=uncultured Clostridium sp. TaxID=59620 RepID=UPI0027DDB1E1|nr:DNA cytosine methyltransferase [uncultured Clostridium sp.]
MIKKRFMKTKNHRIYIQDTELMKTNFKPGKIYTYKFDKKDSSTLKIYIDDNGKKKVSKRTKKDSVNPVIDIRDKDILSQFQKYSDIEIEIYKNEILVHGINKIISIKSKVNKEITARFNKSDINKLYLKNVVNGDFQQLSFDSLLNSQVSEIRIRNKDNFHSYNENVHTGLRFVSLFSGAGILDKGFVDEGFEPQLSIELEQDMVNTYNYNLGNHAVQGDMNEYDINTIPDAEILIGGSPCQDFSNENRISGKNVLDSPKNKLVRKFIEVAKHMKSLKVFVLENVSQILTKGKRFINELKERLSDFDITVKKVNSVDFGSAQIRERAIIIGSKIGKIEIQKPKLKLFKTVRQAFEGLTKYIKNQLDYSKPRKETILKMSYVKQGGNYRDIPEELRGKGNHSNLFSRLEWDKPSITIVNPRKANILHPEENRILTVRECARLFDLPDSFEFLGSLANKQQMVANSVPLKLATAIARTIKQYIFE